MYPSRGGDGTGPIQGYGDGIRGTDRGNLAVSGGNVAPTSEGQQKLWMAQTQYSNDVFFSKPLSLKTFDHFTESSFC